MYRNSKLPSAMHVKFLAVCHGFRRCQQRMSCGASLYISTTTYIATLEKMFTLG